MSPEFEDVAQAQMTASARLPQAATPVPVVPPTSRPPRRPGDPPTRERKLKSLTLDQVDAARALIKPQPFPTRKGNKIVFEPDDTPADAEMKIGPVNKKKPGPMPKSAPAEKQQRQAEIRAARAAITPTPTPADLVQHGDGADQAGDADDGNGATLTDQEMQQVIDWVQAKYGPILNIEQAAELSKFAKQTLRERVSQNMYKNCVVRGRPLRFWAHRFVVEVMKP